MAQFRIVVTVDPTGARRGSKQVEKSLNRVGATANRTGALIARAFSFAILGAGLIRTIGLLANFEQEMATVRAISGATGDQFRDLREEAKRLGITTRFSATQAAEGMAFLARAGFEVDEVLGAIGGTLQLAQAGALDLGLAADIASNILRGFRLEIDQTSRVVDVLALAASSANTTVGQLGQGMKFVAPVAAGLGVSLEETTAAMAALSDAGLQATLAGTGLRRVLSELESPAKKTRDILASLGLTTADVRPSMVGLTEAIKRLADAGVDTGQALELFGDRGGPAFEVMTAAIPQIIKMTGELENATGTAERIARIMDENLNGALLAVRSALEGVILALGDAGATGALNSFFRALARGLRAVAGNIDTFVNALETLAFVLLVKLARRAIPAAIAGVRALGVAILRNPIGLVATAITVAVVALVAFSDQLTIGEGRIATLQDFGIAAFEALGRAVDGVVSFFEDNFGVIADLSKDVFGDVELSIEGVLQVTARVVDGVVGFFKGAADAIVIAFDDLPAALKLIFVRTFNAILKLFTGFINFIIRGVNLVAKAAGREGIALLETFELEAGKRAEDIGERMDRALADGIENQNAALEALDGILKRAEEIARERIGDEAIRETINAIKAAKSELEVVAAREPVDKNAEAFRVVLENLREEAQLLRLSNAEREIQEGLLRVEKSLKFDLTAQQRSLLEAQLRSNQALADERALLDEIRGPQEDYERRLAALNRLLAETAITTEEFTNKQREMRLAVLASARDLESGLERGLLRIADEFGNVATVAEETLVGAFRKAEDALVEFVDTGKIEFRDLVDSIKRDITRLAVRESIVAPLAKAIGIGAQQGGGGLLAGAFKAFSAFGGIGGLFGFQQGGSFQVAGAAGVDRNVISVNNRPVARVSRGETVTVSPEGGGRPIQINFNISTPDANSFQRSQDQILTRAQAALTRANRRNA